MKKGGTWDKTVIVITGDHGQTTAGRHPPEATEAWAMPLVIAGPGIKKAQTFDYAESIDVTPTICFLMGVQPPVNADGRILAEALLNPPKSVAQRLQKIKELDYTLLDVGNAIARLKEKMGTAARRGGADPLA